MVGSRVRPFNGMNARARRVISIMLRRGPVASMVTSPSPNGRWQGRVGHFQFLDGCGPSRAMQKLMPTKGGTTWIGALSPARVVDPEDTSVTMGSRGIVAVPKGA